MPEMLGMNHKTGLYHDGRKPPKTQLDKAKELQAQYGKLSTSFLQRKLRCSQTQAEKIINKLSDYY